MGVFNKVLEGLGLVEPEEETMEELSERTPIRSGNTAAVPTNAARSVTPPKSTLSNAGMAAPSNGNLVQLQPRENKTVAPAVHQGMNAKVVLQAPSDFNQAQKIADSLLNGMGVIINIEECDPDIAEKIIDFVGGVIYAINGDIQKVSAGTILATPANIDISSDLKDEMSKQDNLTSDEVFSWVTSYNQRGEF